MSVNSVLTVGNVLGIYASKAMGEENGFPCDSCDATLEVTKLVRVIHAHFQLIHTDTHAQIETCAKSPYRGRRQSPQQLA